MFVGRKKESRYLEENYAKEASCVLVVYGHRGVGKTSLLLRFAKEKPLHYFCARPCSGQEQILLWKKELQREGAVAAGDAEGSGFDSVFDCLTDEGGKKKLLVIDEFQYLIRYAEDFMPSLLRYVQESSTPVMVVLLSSSVSFVETDFVPRIGPLAASISGFYKLGELGFMDCVNFFQKYSTRQCMEAYSILGGLPAYWAAFSPDKNVGENIRDAILAPSGVLHDEGERMVSSELRELNVYSTILNCLAGGMNKLNDLHVHSGFSRAKISVYLKNLMERELVEKLFPYDNASNANAKKGVYRVTLRFLEFYFRFIFENKSALEQMDSAEFYKLYVAPHLPAFHQSNFRKVCGEYLDILNHNNMLPIKASRSGEWVGKSGTIDIVMQDEDWESILAFCDWQSELIGLSALERDLKIAEEARLHPDHVYLFATGSFSDELKAFAEQNKSVKLIDIDTL